ncbi:MAG: radical SAM family heme chaperone HemW [Deferribacteres bacterium]|nr:radical SAM family heme chaperone HemW [Deferribacteres bacterium]
MIASTQPAAVSGKKDVLSTPDTAAIYLHIPFCEQRCSYCDFYTVAKREQAIPDYVDALLTEIDLQQASLFWQQQKYSTIFFGGGTPSLLSVAQVSRIVEALRSAFFISEAAEVTMEANPGTVSRDQLAGYRQAGVNRLSLGVQSFHEDELRQVDRIHSVSDIYKTVDATRAVGFANLSIDLIFALPGQRPSRWRENLHQAVQLAPEHISAYNLTIEDGTPLYRLLTSGKIRPLSEGRARAVYNFSIDFLAAHGYDQYEVSNYAKAGFHSHHNYKYWDGSCYLGLGASAHSFDGQRRFANVGNYVHYMKKLAEGRLPQDFEEWLTPEQKRFEMIFLGLRRSAGLNLAAYRAAFQADFYDEYEVQMEKMLHGEQPLLRLEDGHLRLTRDGLLLCDAVCAEFLA